MEIVFTNTSNYLIENIEPVPAKKVIPEWYKNTLSHRNKENKKMPDGNGVTEQTIKRCMPVFDALTAGYIISTYVDVYVSFVEGKHWFEWAAFDAVTFHTNDQAPNYPQSRDEPFPKWQNLWSIKTSPGTSCLFIPPVHRESPFAILEAVVDTDSYDHNINFPFIMKDSNFEGLIPAGTPMVQVIPFQRNQWKMKIGGELEKERATKTALSLKQHFFDGYRNNHRKTKDYL